MIFLFQIIGVSLAFFMIFLQRKAFYPLTLQAFA